MAKKCTLSHEPDLQFGIAAEFFRMLGDGTRIKIFWILCHGEECGSHLAERLGITAPAAASRAKLHTESPSLSAL